MRRRIIPPWLSSAATSQVQKDDEILLEKTDDFPLTRKDENKSEEFQFLSEQILSTENLSSEESKTITKRFTRSCSDAVDKNEKEEKKPHEYPFINYTGSTKYCIDMIDIAATCHDITQWVERQVDKEIIPLAFDMEWPFSYQTGAGKTAVIQICVETSTCYIFQLSRLKKLPAALVKLLTHEKVRSHGVNIKNDFRKLGRDFPEVNSDLMIDRCIDLGTWCNEVCDTGGRWSLERLVGYILKLKIDKNKNVRMSQWNFIPLSDKQKLYAAIDVYIGQEIYYELERKQKEKEIKNAILREKYNEKTNAVLKSLDAI